MKKFLTGLYIITDDELTPNKTVLKMVENALIGGANVVQLRDKISNDDQLIKKALDLQKLCKKHNTLFVLNDRVDIAIEFNLQGLHIGSDDYDDLSGIRKNYKGILGVSCYGDIDLAVKAEEQGADYVAFGACFASSTKPNAPTIDLEIIKKAKEHLSIPICAIGGITTENMNKLMCYKPDMVAVISDIWKNEDIKERVMQYNKILSQN